MDASITELDSLGVTPFLASRKPGCSRGSDLGKNHVILDNRPGELPNPVSEPTIRESPTCHRLPYNSVHSPLRSTLPRLTTGSSTASISWAKTLGGSYSGPYPVTTAIHGLPMRHSNKLSWSQFGPKAVLSLLGWAFPATVTGRWLARY